MRSNCGELKFQYNCYHCGKEVRMNTRDIVDFIGTRYYEIDRDDITSFFDKYDKSYNLCPECAREEGFDVNSFRGWED